MRILLVEDERKVANFIARALRENSYAVDVAETGEKALELGTDVPYAAILLDARLPDDIAALDVAEEIARRLLAERPELRNRHFSILVTNQEGVEIGRVPLDVLH